MRDQDRIAFRQAAQRFGVYVLVRHTNPASLAFIGRAGYYPKPIDCKAKTADGNHALAGLVVDPNRVPQAFSPGRLEKAKKEWAKFAPLLGGGRFLVEENEQSDHFGCVVFRGRDYLHGDYDLKDVILAGRHARRNLALVETLHGQEHRRGYRVRDVQDYVNLLIGVPVVQHGGSAQFSDHEDEPVDRFSPDGTWKTMTGLEVDLWYQELKRAVITAAH